MKKRCVVAAALCLALLSYGTSSCTSKSENASTQTNQTSVSSESNPLSALKEGNERFCSGLLSHNHQDINRIKELTEGQHPKAVIITCSDSRVPPEIIFDQGLGDIFTIRTAGNVMSDYEEGSVEYAAEHLHTKLIVVMGHESCGAVTAMLEHSDKLLQKENSEEGNHDECDHITSIIQALENEEEAKEALKETENRCSAMVHANVIHGVKQLRNSKPILSKLHEDKEIQIVGAVYHLDSGRVEFLDI